ncbi:Mitochondrial import inner membrane translocase subunit TIM14 [Parelaphostrongylus tenuis]|uniref:DnaJ homolog subfamily C member 21 n=1 Tax=Parelaphostrongylus tenuis TaxID=148309 RepID=A0AAD5MWM5_PARTN|nr:Mitochondrial import inner membrane translocase subunit TIM14 [Parelaphostrongylus tenuis]
MELDLELAEKYPELSSGLILAGLGLAAAAFGTRYLLRNQALVRKGLEAIPGGAFEKYHRGGFEPKMTRKEAAMILGIPVTANPSRIKEAHRRIMIVNHPDRGGSPYIASKINEAKDLLESPKGS